MDKPNAEQIANLDKLADYLIALPRGYRHFNMLSYLAITEPFWKELDKVEQVSELIHKCGTTACAAGHGPMAGIAPLPGEEWDGYIIRSFGTECGDALWEEVFSSELPGGPVTAGRRIKRVLKTIS